MWFGRKKTQFGIAIKILFLCFLSLFLIKVIHNSGAFYSFSKLNSCLSEDNKIESIYSYLLKSGYADGQITVSTNEKIMQCGFGFEKGYILRPIQNDQEFMYASLTKILVALELLHTDKDIGKQRVLEILPELTIQHEKLEDVKIESLLAHRAGIAKNIENNFFTKKPFCLIFPDIKWLEIHEVGKYNYSNISYCILGQIIERNQKLNFDNIFLKYGFKPTSQNYTILEQNGFIIEKWTEYGIYPENLKGAGGLLGNSRNYHKFIRERLFDEHILDMTDRNYECNENRCPNLLFYRIKRGDHYVYWRNGSLPYVTNLLVVFPDGKIVTIFLNKREKNWLNFSEKLAYFLNFIY